MWYAQETLSINKDKDKNKKMREFTTETDFLLSGVLCGLQTNYRNAGQKLDQIREEIVECPELSEEMAELIAERAEGKVLFETLSGRREQK